MIVDLPDDELAVVIAALRRVIESDRYPLSPRLDPLKAALARLEAASKPGKIDTMSDLKPKAPTAGKVKRGGDDHGFDV